MVSGEQDQALLRTIAARRNQVAFRLSFGVANALGAAGLIGARAISAWLAAYLALLLVEHAAFHGVASGSTPLGRRRPLVLLLLAANSIAFCALASLVLLSPVHYNGLCAAFMLSAALIGTLRGTFGSRDALVASATPVLLNILMLPVQLLVFRFHPPHAILVPIALADLLIAYAGAGLAREWRTARRHEREVTRDRQAAQAENERALLHMVEHDPLTALPKRDRLCARLDLMGAQHGTGALMLLDLDGFKYVNDALGHTAGDVVLKAVAARLTEMCRPEDFIARVGSDEFAIVMPGVNEKGLAIEVGERLLAAISMPITIGSQKINLGACIGVALHPLHGQDTEALLASADLALSREKAEGRHGARLFEADMRIEAFARVSRDKDVARALECGEFELYYQPQVALSTGTVIGAEALLRWRHPERGLLTPDMFLPAIEQGPLAAPVGQWVLETAANHCAGWRARGHRDFTVAVNLFSAQFRAGTLVANVERALASTGLAPEGLEIEITENIMLRPDDDILQPLRILRAAGIGVALDDYGTGYASLDQLKKMPITRLKIDRSFTRTACEMATDATIIRAIALMADAFKLRVTAEGVETEPQAELVRAAGCEDAQGYLFGRPVPAAQFERLHLRTPVPSVV